MSIDKLKLNADALQSRLSLQQKFEELFPIRIYGNQAAISQFGEAYWVWNNGEITSDRRTIENENAPLDILCSSLIVYLNGLKDQNLIPVIRRNIEVEWHHDYDTDKVKWRVSIRLHTITPLALCTKIEVDYAL